MHTSSLSSPQLWFPFLLHVAEKNSASESHHATRISVFSWLPMRTFCKWEHAYPSIILWMGGRRAAQELAWGAATLIYTLEGLSITLDGEALCSGAMGQKSWSSTVLGDMFLHAFCYSMFPDRPRSWSVERQASTYLGKSCLSPHWKGKRVNIFLEGKTWIVRIIPGLPISPSCSGRQ